MIAPAASPPQVSLTRGQSIRMIVVAILVAFSAARVVPEAVRVFVPLGLFDYLTDGNGVVVRAPASPDPGSDALRAGDRVRVDRIKPFDRKPGIAGSGYTRTNPDRYLPIERGGRERILHLRARPESPPSRAVVFVRIFIFVAAVAIGSMLYLLKPSIATFGFFIFTLGGEFPTTFTDTLLDNPWRQIPEGIGDLLRGTALAALLLFVLCLAFEEPRAQRIAAWACAGAAAISGFLAAYGQWLMNYAARPAEGIDRAAVAAADVLTVLVGGAFLLAWLRARGGARQRIGYIVAAFTVAGIARLGSQALFPGVIPFWFDAVLLSAPIIPIAVIGWAVVRLHFFDVDFVVSRAIVYVAVTGAVIGSITAAEEIGTYVFYNNTDLAYGVLIVISMGIGATTGHIKDFLDRFVDRFVFKDRHVQRIALETIAATILDARTVEEVHKMLLHDAVTALDLAFGGLLAQRPDGSFELAEHLGWPEDCVSRLGAEDALTKAITYSRGVLAFSGHDTRVLQHAFPRERLTFAAPLFVERDVVAIVVYGHNVGGLEVDPEERELLVRIVMHASIALDAIEIARLRAERGEANARRLGTV